MKYLLNGAYGAIHGTYWMVYGVITSFASAFLLARGYSNSDIGLILALGSIFSALAQPFAADIADRTRRFSLVGLIQIFAAVVLVLTALMFFLKGKTLALTVVFIMAVAWNAAVQPLVNSLSFKLEVSGYRVHFGIARSIGSLGYALLCALLGSLVDRFGAQSVPVSGVLMGAVLLLILHATKIIFKKACEGREVRFASMAAGSDDAVSADTASAETASHPETAGASRGDAVSANGDYAELFEKNSAGDIDLKAFVKRNKIFLLSYIGIAAIFFGNATYSNFMLQIAQSVGGDSVDMGRILALCAFAEIPAMLAYDKLQDKISCRLVLWFSLSGFLIKAICSYFAQSVALLYVANTMNLIGFGLFMPAIVYFVNSIMDSGEAVKGQAVYPIVNSVSTVLSSLLGGYILDVSGAKSLLLLCLVLTVCGAAWFALLLGKIKSNKGETYERQAI